ncbi:redoxin domain-containing protein [Chitinophaga sp.]|uniref:redoxin domain-containing protein n=1 Tax=Chitinophaga sp. TaxID=1869181 RepID=UPI002C3BCCFE|nr:redoxin domain-containing protein [Chitinophaga sp.]HWV69318.1 redoxin domain-containing protein [Chitinophaga sp.]
MRYSSLFRQWLPAALLMAGTAGAKAQPGHTKPFTLQGRITAPQYTGKLYLQYELSEREMATDSVTLQKDGHFVFNGRLSRPASARIYMIPSATKYVSRRFYLEPGKVEMNATGSIDAATVTGSPNTAVQDEFVRNGEKYAPAFTSLNTRAYYNRGMKDSVRAIDAEMEQVRAKFNGGVAAIIRQHPDAYASWDMVYNYRIGLDPETITPLFDALSPRFKNSEDGKALLKQIANVRRIMVGSPAPDFTQADVAGNTIKLSSFRGKYTLVDFWASWCGICRAENPNVLRAYNAYKDKGFTVLGVSLDDSLHRTQWIQAIKDDNMPWQQVSDLKGRNNEAAVQYGIKGIPQNVLIDPNGKIIAKNKRNRDLMNTLMDIFDKGYNMRMDGTIKGENESSIVFKYYKDNEYRNDTVSIHNGKFTWLAEMQESQRVNATILPKREQLSFFSDIGYLQLSVNTDSLPNFSLEGSDMQDEANRFYASTKELSPKQKELLQQLTDAPQEERFKIGEQLLSLARNRYTENVKKYVKEHPANLFSLQLVKDMAEDISGPKYNIVYPLYTLLPEVSRGTPSGRRIAAMLPMMKRSAEGATIANLSQADSSGHEISLAGFKGKYVLIDFWASWCGPCRAENPNLLKAYNTFKSKDFTIVGISLDSDAGKWKKAIKEDKLPWTQLSDLKGRENAIAQYYNVRGIPWNILVDRDGKIVAKDLRGSELEKKLLEMIK